MLRCLAQMEAQLFQALLEDVFAGHGCVMLLVDDVAFGLGEVNADVSCGDESEPCHNAIQQQQGIDCSTKDSSQHLIHSHIQSQEVDEAL